MPNQTTRRTFLKLSAPTELSPARDRLIGIILALVVMAFVFDLIWPVRTVTAMRGALAEVLINEANFCGWRRPRATMKNFGATPINCAIRSARPSQESAP